MNSTLLTLAMVALSPAADPYPNPKILVEPEVILQSKADRPIFLDARDEAAYKAGHIPDAIRMPVQEWSKAVPDRPESWARRLADLGIGTGAAVVVYGGADAREATRAWWLLKYAGAENVRLLNGGFPAWEKAGGTASTRVEVAKPIDIEKPNAQPGRLAEKKDVLSMLKGPAQIVDTRSEDEYYGTSNKAKRNGHIPGAIPLEWSELLGKDQKFKSAVELRKLFAEKKIDLERPAITYCQSGGRASVVAFGFELMGAKNVRNYYKSWAEWGNAEDTPVTTPKK